MEIIVTSHGNLCKCILESYEMIAGQSQKIISLPLLPDDTGQYKEKLAELILEKKNSELLILCDIVGGTPYNESFQQYLKEPEKIRVVSGLNLAMLIEAGLAIDSAKSIQSLAELSMSTGIESVVLASLDDYDQQEDIEF